jgi:hypothetical protein
MIMHLIVFDYLMIGIFIISLSAFFQPATPVYLKWFSVYFLGALVTGMVERWQTIHGHYNSDIENFWGIIEFCFYFFVIREVIIRKKIKRLILFVLIVYALFSFFNILFIQKKAGLNSVNFTIGCLITVIFCIIYFVELFQKTETQTLARLPAFWMVSGILFNTVLSFPVYAFSSFMEESTRADAASQIIYKNLDSIVLIIVVLTFVLYMIGFLCRIRTRKFTL